MGRHIRWQAILTFTGIAMTMAFLGFLAFSRTTVTLPDVGGTYTEGIAGIPQFINPLLAQYNQVDQDLSALIFNGLTRFDGQGELQPDLPKAGASAMTAWFTFLSYGMTFAGRITSRLPLPMSFSPSA